MDERLSQYFHTSNPGDRLDILEKLRGESDLPLDFILSIFNRRYVKKKRSGDYMDTYLAACLGFVATYHNVGMMRKRYIKEAKEKLIQMGSDLADTDEKKEILLLEMRHGVGTYLDIYLENGYQKKILGITYGAANTDKTERMSMECFYMSDGLSKKLDLYEEMDLWNKAVSIEFEARKAYLEEIKRNTGGIK